MEIEIKQEHIDNGLRNSASMCPVALALREKFGKLIYVYSSFSADASTGGILFTHSHELAEWIQRYDAGNVPLGPGIYKIYRKVQDI